MSRDQDSDEVFIRAVDGLKAVVFDKLADFGKRQDDRFDEHKRNNKQLFDMVNDINDKLGPLPIRMDSVEKRVSVTEVGLSNHISSTLKWAIGLSVTLIGIIIGIATRMR